MRGLNIEPGWLAEAILDGRSQSLVKAIRYSIEEEAFILLSEQCALGIVVVGTCEEIPTVRQLRKRKRNHLITDLVRRRWATKRKSWFRGPFYAWPVAMRQRFSSPLITDAPCGPTVVLNDVDIME